ncbi:MAG: 3-phosphoshikimate 1-carboxyvinyltransferase [Slackia sp.]|nr:3-phosphoshikimate 1-carboxyvinyltransferase [Slackia sp.]
MSAHKPMCIDPLEAPLRGIVRMPGDKSISHRAVLFAAMAQGTSRLSGVLDSDDVRASVHAVERLGARVSLEKMADGSLAGDIAGWGAAGPRVPDGPIDCGNSGTTARLLMGMLSSWDIEVELTGDASLRRRPMRRVTAPLEKMGARFFPEGDATLPLTVRGTSAPHAVDYDSPVASAQVKTALLLAGIRAAGTTRITEPAPSRNHTELMLPRFGVAVASEPGTVRVKGPATMRACAIRVPGDPSSAAFPACAAALVPGSAVRIEGVSLNPSRIGFVRVLERMGVDAATRIDSHAGGEPAGAISVRYCDDLHACDVPAESIASLIDEVPVLCLVAAYARGTTVFHGVSELRVKETDRIAGIIDGLSAIGVHAWMEGDDLHIEGNPGLSVPDGVEFASKGDHRLAMTWALVGFTGGASVRVADFESVSVSYPGFLADIRSLEGGR